jgi:nondiscriminating glutamyl-tRNA synthetase
LGERMVPFLQKAGFEFTETPGIIEWIGKTAKIVSNYHYLLTEIAEGFEQFTTSDCNEAVINSIKNSEESQKVISILSDQLKQLDSPVDFSKIVEITKNIQQQEGIKGKALYHPIRLALTGKESGIELKDFIPIIEMGSVLDIKPPVQNMISRLKVFTVFTS